MSNPLKTEAIKNFLNNATHQDLSALYSANMECQVNVAQDDGELVIGEYKGNNYKAYTDGNETWKVFRIPYHADTKPEYEDKPLTWNLAKHVDAIGMTGWDWKNKLSRWVAFDFDSVMNHAGGLTQDELDNIIHSVTDIPWVTLRKSTSGSGFHIYVFLNVPTENHTEHAALARSILGQISALSGIVLESKVDTCGGNMWVWGRKMLGTDGLTLIKSGSTLDEPPPNWRDHVKVIRVSNRRQEAKDADFLEQLSGQYPRVSLDDEHRKLLAFLEDSNSAWWWDQDHYALVAHTYMLQKAHKELGFKGVFKTNSTGSDLTSQNCFCFPLPKGAWVIRRFGNGCQEDTTWTQDNSGWTKCFYNAVPDLLTASRAEGGLEDTTGEIVFKTSSAAVLAASILGAAIAVPKEMEYRGTTLKEHKDGRLIVSIKQEEGDSMPGWLGKKGKWVKMFNTTSETVRESEISTDDEKVRHLVDSKGNDADWVLLRGGAWGEEPVANVRAALQSIGYSSKEATQYTGGCILNPWKIINRPFDVEYPGDRVWNRFGAKFKYTPSEDKDNLSYPTWTQMLNHCGSSLDSCLSDNEWARENGVCTGADYLKIWIASLFQNPYEHLPYLFFYGNENTGKSSFHVALKKLFTEGYMFAKQALKSKDSFNYEIEGKVLCVVEEIDLSKEPEALHRIKDWVTSPDLLIHRKGDTPYHSDNTTHWIQCANFASYCPTFPGDTRITVFHVPDIPEENRVPEHIFSNLLEKEAPDFLAAVLNLEIPESNDRLKVPVIESAEKSNLQNTNETSLSRFLEDFCDFVDGGVIKFSEFYRKFNDLSEDSETFTKNRLSKEFPLYNIISGRYAKDNGQRYMANLVWKDAHHPEGEKPWILKGKMLTRQE
jgi:hypothetical protein